MTFSRTQTFKLGFAALIFAVAPAANCDGGDRNQGYGSCPAGNTCSGDTPDGLDFVAPIIGEGFFDQGEVKIIAAGGTETIRLEDPDGTPFELPYAAAVSGTAAAVASSADGTLVLRASAAPSAEVADLRITDPSDGALYDQISVTVQPLLGAQLALSLSESLAALEDGTPMLFAPGGGGIVSLLGVSDRLLIDDSLTLTGAGITQPSWDQFVVGQLPPGMHTLTASSAGRAFPLTFEVAAGPDRLAPTSVGSSLAVGSSGLVCFEAFLGARYIHASWAFSADNADLTAVTFEGCVSVAPRVVGQTVLLVKGGGLALDVTIAATPAQHLVRTPSPRGSLGDRAAANAAE